MKLKIFFLIMTSLVVVFTGGCKKDEPGVRPLVASTNPVSNAVNIPINNNVTATFSGQVTLSATSHFEGIILSKTGITLQTGASMNGIALAQTAVILDQNAVTKPQ